MTGDSTERTEIKSAHLLQIRNKIDCMNIACTIPPPPPLTWTMTTTDLASGQLIRSAHFNELKGRIRDIYAVKGMLTAVDAGLDNDNTVWDDSVTSQGAIVYKRHVTDMRAALDGLATLCLACGNGVVEPGEQCDDGNTTAGDGCSSCQYEVCQPDGFSWDRGGLPISVDERIDTETCCSGGATCHAGTTICECGPVVVAGCLADGETSKDAPFPSQMTGTINLPEPDCCNGRADYTADNPSDSPVSVPGVCASEPTCYRVSLECFDPDSPPFCTEKGIKYITDPLDDPCPPGQVESGGTGCNLRNREPRYSASRCGGGADPCAAGDCWTELKPLCGDCVPNNTSEALGCDIYECQDGSLIMTKAGGTDPCLVKCN